MPMMRWPCSSMTRMEETSSLCCGRDQPSNLNPSRYSLFHPFSQYTGCPPKSGTADFQYPASKKCQVFLTSLNRASYIEENDTKIIEFGWVILILWPDFCDRLARNYVENGLSYHVLRNPIEPCFFCWHGSMGFPKTPRERLFPDIILRSSIAKIKRNLKMTVFQEIVIESKLLNQIQWSWFHSLLQKILYLMM